MANDFSANVLWAPGVRAKCRITINNVNTPGDELHVAASSAASGRPTCLITPLNYTHTGQAREWSIIVPIYGGALCIWRRVTDNVSTGTEIEPGALSATRITHTPSYIII